MLNSKKLLPRGAHGVFGTVGLVGATLVALSCSSTSNSPGSPSAGSGPGPSGGSGGGSPVGAGTGFGGSVNPGSGGAPLLGAGMGGAPPVGTAGAPPVGGGNPGGGGAPGSSGSPGSSGAGPIGGNAPTAGTGPVGNAPPGYWTQDSYKGCVWTGVDTTGVGTTISPQDFTMKAAGGPYCVAGTVGPHPKYESVALLGFNLAEPETASCTYKPVDANAAGPPAVMFPSTATGIALNFAVNKASTLRIQIQGPNGAKDENDRWCYTVPGAGGKVFAKFTDFNTKCWTATATAAATGNPYKGEPISAVVFNVPGALTATPFDYCINGFKPGTSAADAPDGGATGGVLSGTIGGPGARDLDFQRVKVLAANKSYIIQNNNWGNPEGTDQTISYKGNSFTITGPTGAGDTSGAPASFPSIYIGGNGNVASGAFSTRSDDGLPKQINQITSVMSTFKYNRAEGGYNAAYDIWFSASPPTAEYTDAISGFVMLWLYDPGNAQPIGSIKGTYTGAGGTWDVWSGRRGGSGANANAPVVSFVNKANGTLSFTGDLKPFFVEASKPEYDGGINQSWYLTDVFGGFEIWNGGGTNGLSVTEFTAVVQ